MSNDCNTYPRLTPFHTYFEQPLTVYQDPILTVEMCSVKCSVVSVVSYEVLLSGHGIV